MSNRYVEKASELITRVETFINDQPYSRERAYGFLRKILQLMDAKPSTSNGAEFFNILKDLLLLLEDHIDEHEQGNIGANGRPIAYWKGVNVNNAANRNAKKLRENANALIRSGSSKTEAQALTNRILLFLYGSHGYGYPPLVRGTWRPTLDALREKFGVERTPAGLQRWMRFHHASSPRALPPRASPSRASPSRASPSRASPSRRTSSPSPVRKWLLSYTPTVDFVGSPQRSPIRNRSTSTTAASRPAPAAAPIAGAPRGAPRARVAASNTREALIAYLRGRGVKRGLSRATREQLLTWRRNANASDALPAHLIAAPRKKPRTNA